MSACFMKGTLFMKRRCSWVPENIDIYVSYHDKEWGVPVYNDRLLYEMLILESFQAGLSWLTILKKREGFKHAFCMFDPVAVANFGEDDIARLKDNPEIIRCERKIRAAITNSRIFLDIQREFGSFSNYIWSFTDGKVIKNMTGEVLTTSPLSDTVSKDMKKRGMKYVGSTIIYSYLQSVGVINDHAPDCFRYNEVDSEKRA